LVRSLRLNETSSGFATPAALSAAGQRVAVVAILAGVGSVTGRVFQGNGATPAAGAAVQVRFGTISGDVTRTVLTDGAGRFSLSNIAVGPYQLTVRLGALGVRAAGNLQADGETQSLSLTLAPSGSVIGRLLRADGTTPVGGEGITLEFPATSLPAFVTRTSADGRFAFASVPLGGFVLHSV